MRVTARSSEGRAGLSVVRRGVRLSVVVVISLTATACATWSQLGGAASHTGYQSLESTISPANVSSLGERWTGFIGGWHGLEGATQGPVVANGVVYLAYAGSLLAFDAAGKLRCTTTCAPLWTTASTGFGSPSTPAVADGVVFVASHDGVLSAFDAAGVDGCSGTPTTCAPLWTESTGVLSTAPAVAGGRVYTVSTDGLLSAFDARGATNCSAVNKSCSPRWTAEVGTRVDSSPAVAGGVVYFGASDGSLYAFDAAGARNCDPGTQKCAPLWRAVGLGSITAPPVVADGRVFVGSSNHRLYVFDTAATTGCSGTPRSCAPIWSATADDAIGVAPALAYGTVYVATVNSLAAFDAAGTTGCSGVPKTCSARWTAPLVDGDASSPIVANHLVYIGSGNPSGLSSSIRAFDAAGVDGCSGTPTTCTPRWTSPARDNEALRTPVVVNGTLFAMNLSGNAVDFLAFTP